MARASARTKHRAMNWKKGRQRNAGQKGAASLFLQYWAKFALVCSVCSIFSISLISQDIVVVSNLFPSRVGYVLSFLSLQVEQSCQCFSQKLCAKILPNETNAASREQIFHLKARLQLHLFPLHRRLSLNVASYCFNNTTNFQRRKNRA